MPGATAAGERTGRYSQRVTTGFTRHEMRPFCIKLVPPGHTVHYICAVHARKRTPHAAINSIFIGKLRD